MRCTARHTETDASSATAHDISHLYPECPNIYTHSQYGAQWHDARAQLARERGGSRMLSRQTAIMQCYGNGYACGMSWNVASHGRALQMHCVSLRGYDIALQHGGSCRLSPSDLCAYVSIVTCRCQTALKSPRSMPSWHPHLRRSMHVGHCPGVAALLQRRQCRRAQMISATLVVASPKSGGVRGLVATNQPCNGCWQLRRVRGHRR